jgi:hypothetical protein
MLVGISYAAGTGVDIAQKEIGEGVSGVLTVE